MVTAPGGIGSFTLPRDPIRFTPDPGEPAVRLSAPPHQTALLVNAQEQRNETRLRNQAIAEGNDIIFSQRTFTVGFNGVSPVYNAGLTTLSFREDPNGILPDTVIQPAEREQRLAVPQEAETEEEEEENPLETEGLEPLAEQADEKNEEELRTEEQELENEDQRLERNLTRASLEQNQALQTGDPFQAQQAQREINQLAREQEELEEEQRENELDQLEIQLEETQDTSTEAINQNVQSSRSLLGVLFGFPDDEPQGLAA